MNTGIFSLQYPFPSKFNPNGEIINSQISKWIDYYDCLSDNAKAKAKVANVGYLAAWFWPAASWDRLIPLGRWLIWTLIYDDFYGPYPVDQLKQVCQRAVEIFRGAALSPKDNEILRQIAYIREELLPISTTGWMDRFVNNNATFMEAMLTERLYSYGENVHYMNLQDYILFRDRVSAVLPTIDLIEIAIDFILSPDIVNRDIIRRLRLCGNRLVSWSNDCFSVKKDLERKEASNMVLVIQHEQNCSVQAAYAQTVQLHNAVIEEFVGLKEVLRKSDDFTASIDNYITNLSMAIHGHVLWYSMNERYK